MMKELLVCIAALLLPFFVPDHGLAEGHLDRRSAAIVPIAAFTAAGDDAALARALEDGLENGLTINEIREILIQMYAYCGFPRSLSGLSTFMKVLEDRKGNGKEDAVGKMPETLPPEADRNKIGTDIQTALLGRPAAAPVYKFAPAIDQFLKEHLFCDIFSRGVLTDQEREIATVAALAALPAKSQLRSHMGFALNTGLTPDELNDVIMILKENVGLEAGKLAEITFWEALASRKAK